MLRRIVHSLGVAPRARPGELQFAFRAWLLMPLVESLVASIGVASTLRCVGLVPLTRRASSPAVGVQRGRVCVEHAARRHVVRGRCLVRSIVQHTLHRADGTPSTLVVGVRRGTSAGTHELEAHAWLAAHDAELAGDAEEATFRPILVMRADARAPSSPPS